MKQLSSVMLLVVAVGCGGGNSRPPVVDEDDDIDVDAPPSANCNLSDTATATSAMQFAGFDTSADPNSAEFVVQTDINADAAPDIANILLFDGFGAFMTGGIPAGASTIQLTGVEAQFQSCGACVLAITDINDQGESPDTGYLVTSGTMNLEVVTQQQLKGTITNATFTHVNIDDMTAESTPHPDGCTATIGTIAFDTVPTDANMMKRTDKLSRVEALRALKYRR